MTEYILKVKLAERRSRIIGKQLRARDVAIGYTSEHHR